MKANELMIGDWVCLEDDNTPRQVDWIRSGEFGLFWGRTVTPPYLKPIPLTPEILKKNGFAIEEREGDPTFPYLAFIIDNDEYRIEITWYDSHDVYEPNTGKYLYGAPEVWGMEILSKCGNCDCCKNKLYLHELQHALRLCGIEKTIEL